MGYGKITAKQQEILEYIKDEILKKGYPPAVREIDFLRALPSGIT